jgi:hypothetical protein
LVRSLPLTAALGVCLIGWVLAWLGGPFEGDLQDVCGETVFVEGSSYEIEPALLPPGASTCVVITPTGTRQETTFVPWREWFATLLFAAGTGMGLAALTAAGSTVHFVVAWLGLGIAGAVAWFISPLIALALLAITIVLAVMLARLRDGA